jgi:hypothetical protein
MELGRQAELLYATGDAIDMAHETVPGLRPLVYVT